MSPPNYLQYEGTYPAMSILILSQTQVDVYRTKKKTNDESWIHESVRTEGLEGDELP